MSTHLEQRIESQHIIIEKLFDLFAEYGYNYREARELLQDAVHWLDVQPVQPASSTDRL